MRWSLLLVLAACGGGQPAATRPATAPTSVATEDPGPVVRAPTLRGGEPLIDATFDRELRGSRLALRGSEGEAVWQTLVRLAPVASRCLMHFLPRVPVLRLSFDVRGRPLDPIEIAVWRACGNTVWINP